MKFNLRYFVLFLLLLATEILIALFVHDTIIRPYIGDLLVVILLYCFIKSFFATPVFKTAIAVLAFAFLVELLQYFNIVQWLGLQHSKAARIIIGSSFEWKDLLAYMAGAVVIILFERRRKTS
ncbi:DUF2809 domain-containing protein [Lacibacter luteus]|uniref:DUF2809 domain-containing protein n=1 Tax=Lacibacter luteus TaxID=2508719 RepID=A0A4V1M7X0_9BACT|nr:DUF2809 domain-containing protein [Lacibacter luteus]RXK61822.1 DUF2809 domain-containing protein [Lacibacter luteus]